MIPALRHTNPQPYTVLRLAIASVVLVLLGFLWLIFPRSQRQEARMAVHAPASSQSERINLALRRTAHHLLLAAGDSTSRIPAVQQRTANSYRLRLDHAFDYDKLPTLLQTSFAVHQIKGDYNVAVFDCATNALQLGYTIRDLSATEPVPCGGRSITAGCYVLQVTFSSPTPSAPNAAGQPLWPLLALGGLAGVGLLFFLKRRNAVPNGSELRPEPTPEPERPHRIQIGQSRFDPGSQVLTVGATQHNLTYREAKLLRVLVSHANQVMERDRILQLVWEDEGVTVGRSVDVFISRLRKLLRDDPSIRIAAVHGVGYRFEIQHGTDPET